ncbi:MAG: hypothetical protein AABY22_12515 [Nanoarchaeota archaeon]
MNKIIEVSQCSINKNWGDKKLDVQFTHFAPTEPGIELPYLPSFMLVLTAGSVKIGQKFRMTLEEIE